MHTVVFLHNSKMIASDSIGVEIVNVKSIVKFLDFRWKDSLFLCTTDTINIFTFYIV